MSLRPRFLLSALAALASVLLVVAAPAKATPITFDPTIANNISLPAGSFTGTVTPTGGSSTVTVRLQAGWIPSPPADTAPAGSFTLTAISLTGQNIVGTFNPADAAFSDVSPNFSSATPYLFDPEVETSTDFATYATSFTIPANTFSVGQQFQTRVGLSGFGNGGGVSSVVQFEAVPEPATVAMLAAGGVGLAGGLIRRRRLAAKG
jgi:hypothetical protein